MMAATSAPASGLAGAVRLVVKLFLEEKHYRSLHRVLSDQWKNCHSLTAAMRLMEAHGVRITKEEEARLASLPEERMIDALVSRMPGQSREQFEHFFLQLSLIASTTTRLRTALEGGKPEVIEEALENAENVGILNYLLKMAVVQAGGEVATKEAEHDEWIHNTENKMGPLLTSQAEATQLRKALDQVKAQLGMQRVNASEKTKKVLASLATGSNNTLLSVVLVCWDDAAKREKRENEIRLQYDEEIQRAAKNLTDYKAKQVATIRNVLLRDIDKNREELMAYIFDMIKQEWVEKKEMELTQQEATKLEAMLQKAGESTAANAKKVLLRMNAANDEGLMRMVIKGFVTHHLEYKQNKEIEDLIKTKEKQINEHMKNKTEGQKNVIQRMVAATGSGLVQSCFKEWSKHTAEEKAGEKLQELLDEKMKGLGLFADRNSGAAMKAATRLALIMEGGILILVVTNWKKFAKIDRVARYAKDKNHKKRQQLMGVKDLFKGFAKDLEGGLKDGTPRIEPPPKS